MSAVDENRSPAKLSLDELTDAQREAVEHVAGPLLILAGPGSGKTRVITHRIAHLMGQGVAGGQILALTFTNKAADEMQRRVGALAPGQPVWVGTFHRFCAQLLRRHAALVGLEASYSIYDAADSRRALKHVLEALNVDSVHFTPERIAHHISWAKNNLVAAEDYEPRMGHALGRIVGRVYPAYQQFLLDANAVDFDDLLLHVAQLLQGNPDLRRRLDAQYQYVMVDEYQDTNRAQYQIVRALSVDHPNLAVTGDPDQSIYAWRGANLSNILDFESDYRQARVVRLERNYRSTKRILRVASALIEHNRRRKKKGLYTENDEGAPVRLIQYATQKSEAASIAARIAADFESGRRELRDFAIFYRTNALSRELEDALRHAGLPYQMVRGQEFYQRAEIKDVLAYLTLLNNPRDDMALLRIINRPARQIGKKTVETLVAHARERRICVLEAARQAGVIEGLSSRAAVATARFIALYDKLTLAIDKPVKEIVACVLEDTGYRAQLVASDDEEDQERLANIEELLTAAGQFDEDHSGPGQLEEFLEGVSLVNDVDDWDETQDRVTMMTLHASKGLEFPVVYIVAMEEGLIPHQRSSEDESQLEEERRLLFVGITRAQDELQLSIAARRDFRGQRRTTVPSRFLFEIPGEELDWEREEAPNDPYGTGASFPSNSPSVRPANRRPAAEPEFADDADWAQADSVASGTSPEVTKSSSDDSGGKWSITTAAELLGDVPANSGANCHEFQPGMRVTHPNYGNGQIVAINERGMLRTASVCFDGESRHRSFVLEKSALRPLDG